ncbi:MAG TPA: bifunctional (p)ppGpp synthetase/guanosine-3',5'-bis(diphosphate) 3'-pyrophosphohydrolase [Sedimentibacter sp.]|jgi:GTP pyrophosphokinase|nr:bifunctional (p)ppGpp synthetase/guanosine-3',5'-bis(diphosphate) 3'-pyrophosphohydrolase [Sedimentibacter sp.]HPB80085.1 bifunctional (p)ppGpp synthetase/guanosine-3',5'-bis(diphosphate) 3'-pyrophosphohydrolase [Sedimentibacter sp.]HPV85178.1 bifunctional (p)ppGpp synthetase/guanosine-3',5'-bis(diphosphate) 3'-pyrophosphohydrolase [Sedimentibacter sp.]HPY55714.1 bifunctional (p)ppGpp synthetase/guanosine-3',5'-bis(diphosphate) 3'-pyrophosphohydrolase [Sedimentibacter sp.]HQC70014.1 bifuncti
MLGNIISQIESYNPNADLGIVAKAYNFAEMAHSNAQTRFSGERYFIHPYNVALILADLHMDVQTVCAGLLHDVVEDTGITFDEIKREFGEEIANMVDGVTKLSKVKYRNKEERQAESLRKMIVAMSKDIRVVIIKLADRLHNIRTLQYMPKEKQYQKAMETIEIYAPIANRLGIASIKWELEDLSLKYIDPEGYEDLLKKVQEKSEKRKDYISHIIDIINKKLQESGMEADIKGRPKSLYSIYKKMYYKNRLFEQIYDLIAIRIIVENIKDCYGALGIVHTLWKPVPGRFKDYIAMPKPNMYQSLHTTVIGPEGEPFEIQIRTLEMHRTAEYGIAAHWKYKEGIDDKTKYEEKLNWLRQMLEWQQETNDPQEFMEALKIDLYTDEVFVFTPKGEVINLPTGSTPIDFAYRVHTAVGNKCVGAKVNGRIVPLDAKLKTGDQVEILTSQSSVGPSRDWLKIAASSQAKSKIRKFFKDRDKDFNVEKGKELVEREIKKQGYQVADLLKDDWIKTVADKYNMSAASNLFAAVGSGGITESQIVNRLKLIYLEKNKDKLELDRIENLEKSLAKSPQRERHTSGVIIKGIDNIKVRFSKCCNPVPGDAIVGYITRGRGVSIHRADCTNIHDLSDSDDQRFIEVQWDNKEKATFISELQIKALDRPKLLQDITSLYVDAKLNAVSLNLRINKEKVAIVDIGFEINDIKQIEDLIKKMKKLDGVLEVYRNKK